MPVAWWSLASMASKGPPVGGQGHENAAVTDSVPRPLEPPFPGGPGRPDERAGQRSRARASRQGRRSFFFDSTEKMRRFTCIPCTALRVHATPKPGCIVSNVNRQLFSVESKKKLRRPCREVRALER